MEELGLKGKEEGLSHKVKEGRLKV